jgi:hypothetical protein
MEARHLYNTVRGIFSEKEMVTLSFHFAPPRESCVDRVFESEADLVEGSIRHAEQSIPLNGLEAKTILAPPLASISLIAINTHNAPIIDRFCIDTGRYIRCWKYYSMFDFLHF